MYDLTRFTLTDMVICGSTLRNMGQKMPSLEETAQKIVHFFYTNFLDPNTGEPACALVRFYKTHNYQRLDSTLQSAAARALGAASPFPSMKCLVLLGTMGDQPLWNARTNSEAHQAIPLASEALVQQSPMIAQLIHQMGLPLTALLDPNPRLLTDLADRRFNVFYVPDAQGSPYIPAQQGFVIPYGIRSVLGFGGLLNSGDLFAAILFSKVSIPPETVTLFKELARDTRVALTGFTDDHVFNGVRRG